MDEVSHAAGDRQELSVASAEIPFAVRDVADAQPQSRRLGWVWGAGAVAIALTAAVGIGLRTQSATPSSRATLAAKEIMGQAIDIFQIDSKNPDANPLFGHLPYQEAPRAELQPIVSNGSILMRRAAAEKYLEMVAAAKADGIDLVPISGFRSIDDQNNVFFSLKAERGQAPTTRAEVSAPPGYSEHHTGYAVDVGDGDRSDANLQPDFEETPAFAWLQQNAVHYNFEMSFPKNNPQGVSYEPWHWRFVGDRDSLETFYRAKTAVIKGQK